ncbi:MAG: hypothetical protein ACFFDI_29460 [Promethearchaeota archaeon]
MAEGEISNKDLLDFIKNCWLLNKDITGVERRDTTVSNVLLAQTILEQRRIIELLKKLLKEDE